MNASIFRNTSLVVSLLAAAATFAAPIESVESSRAGAAVQTIDAFLQEQAVAQQLTALGVTAEQVRTRLARLNDTQLAQLAAQIDILRAGGDIQGGNPHPWGPLACIFRPLGRLLHDLYQLLFCWGTPARG